MRRKRRRTAGLTGRCREIGYCTSGLPVAVERHAAGYRPAPASSRTYCVTPRRQLASTRYSAMRSSDLFEGQGAAIGIRRSSLQDVHAIAGS